jgi:hypothetical protein
MNMTPAERKVVRLLLTRGPIRGTAQVGFALWPDREMTPQGAAVAVGGILRRLVNKRYVRSWILDGITVWACTTLGDHAQEMDRLSNIDPRQLSLIDED